MTFEAGWGSAMGRGGRRGRGAGHGRVGVGPPRRRQPQTSDRVAATSAAVRAAAQPCTGATSAPRRHPGVVRQHPGPAGLRRRRRPAGSRSGSAGSRRPGTRSGRSSRWRAAPATRRPGTAPDFVAMIGGLHRRPRPAAGRRARDRAVDRDRLRAAAGVRAAAPRPTTSARSSRACADQLDHTWQPRRRVVGARRRPVRHGERRARPRRRGRGDAPRARWTCTATRTAAGSRRSSPRATRSCCAR